MGGVQIIRIIRYSKKSSKSLLSGNKHQLCLVFASCVHRRVVEGYGVGSAEYVVYVGVHGE